MWPLTFLLQLPVPSWTQTLWDVIQIQLCFVPPLPCISPQLQEGNQHSSGFCFGVRSVTTALQAWLLLLLLLFVCVCLLLWQGRKKFFFLSSFFNPMPYFLSYYYVTISVFSTVKEAHLRKKSGPWDEIRKGAQNLLY